MRIQRYIYVIFIIFFCSCVQNKSTKTNNSLKDSVMREKDVVIKMNPNGGVYNIPCVVNGVKMDFIFDTGASNVCLSQTEALFLYKNGLLTDSDIIGKTQSVIADGSIVENTEVLLHSIDVGGILITDVKALVSSTIDAPLLLGQSAIKKLGSFEVKGDTLLIRPNRGNVVSIKALKSLNEKKNQIVPPKDKWYDDIAIFLGISKKVDKYLECAKEALNNNMPELAVKFCNKAIECDSSRWEPYGVKGYILTQQGDNNSIPCLLKYKNKNIEMKDYFFLSGDSLRYNKCIYYLAVSYLEKENPTKAIETAQQLLCNNLHYIPAMDVISWAYTYESDYEKATIWANKMLDLHTEDGIAYFRFANIATAKNNISEAVRYYEKVIERQDDNSCLAAAYNNLAIIYKSSNIEYAISLYIKAAKLGNKDACNNLRSLGVNNW